MKREPDYYVLTPIYPPKEDEFRLVNASVGNCRLCGEVATGMGGSDADVCRRCGDVVISGKAIGAIKWGTD